MTAAIDVTAAAADTVRRVETLAQDAVRHGEKHGHDGRVVVVDGQALVPATRALPGAAAIWERADGTWLEYDRLVETGVDAIAIPAADGAGAWTLMWVCGLLYASPDAIGPAGLCDDDVADAVWSPVTTAPRERCCGLLWEHGALTQRHLACANCPELGASAGGT